MKGKPFLVAVAAFAIVLLGGAAMAGIGLQMDTRANSDQTFEAAEQAATATTEPPKEVTTTSQPTEKPSEAEVAKDPVKDEPTKVKDEPVETKDHEKSADGDAADKAPIFTLDYPADGSHVTSKVATFGGTATEGASVHRGKYEAALREGEWSIDLVLSPGKNRVAFKAVGAEGRTAEASVTIYYDAPEGEEKDPPKEEEAPFSAHQKYGSCGEEVPYDVFYGKAEPGAKISASSEYGSNSTTANEHGKWEMKVKFPDSPVGQTFKVTIKSSTGESKTFKFTNTGGGKDH